MTDDHDTAVRYLRGELDGVEMEAFEERIIADDELHTLVEAAEGELLDTYLDDRLPPAVRDRLRHRLAVEPRLRERLVMIAALREHAARRITRRSAHRLRWWWFAAPAALAAAVVGLWFVTASRERPDPVIASLVLETPTRASTVPEISLVHAVSRLRLSLDIAPATPPTIALRGPGGVVPATLQPGAASLIVEIEAGSLRAGLYELVVSAADADPVLYQFRVTRP